MPDDTLLWLDCKGSDEKALEAIFLQFHKELFQYGFTIIRNRELVNDCIQDLFLELWQSRARLSQPASVKAYLFSALRYKVIRGLKKEVIHERATGNSTDPFECSYETVLVDAQERDER